jgi:hypothetical protein
VEMILLDWTRMGHAFCLAGVIYQDSQYRVVRPLPASAHGSAIPNAGWPASELAGWRRWEVLELIDPEPAAAQPPHLEDVWVRKLHRRWRLASPEDRRSILQATVPGPGELLFGVPLVKGRATAHLRPRTGKRSLTSLLVHPHQLAFHVGERQGRAAPDHRVHIEAVPLCGLQLPITDHHLLLRAEQAGLEPRARAAALTAAVREMGDPILIRLGLTRPFSPGRTARVCAG